MTDILFARAEGTTVDRSLDADLSSEMGRAEGRGISPPMLILGPEPSVDTVPDGLRLEITATDGTQLINDFVARRNLSFTVEHNGSGTISFDTDLPQLTGGLTSVLLDPSNLVRVHFGDMPNQPYGIAEGFLTAAPPVQNEDGSWSLSLTGMGSWDVLEFGLLWPPAGATGDTREFSYTAGMTAPGFVASEWHTPIGKLVKKSFRWKHRWPRGWSESRSQWIWVTSPEKNGPLRTCWFIGDPFTLTSAADVHFDAAGDETMKLYLNGARIKTKRRGAWKRKASFTRRLKAGTYRVSAEVSNVSGGDNKSGFICAVSQLRRDGSRAKYLLRSSPSTFKVKVGASMLGQVPLPPSGWYAPAVLKQVVEENAARGVEFHPNIVMTFDSTKDSSGSAWTTKGPVEYDIGISNAELGDKIRSLGYDAAMLPGLRLATWKSRGFDLRDRVFIPASKDLGWSSRTWGRVRTVGLTHQESGWTETLGDVGGPYGRREMAISGGGVDGDQQADVFAAAALNTAASPEETIEGTVTSAMMMDPDNPAPIPLRDFDVADIISIGSIGAYQAVKVMAITAAEQDDKEVFWTIAGYPV